jgi:cytoskeletal protein RodZ
MPKFSKEELQEITDRTEQIEAKREEKRLEREEKRKEKELKRKREFREKLVGPILLMVTIIVTLILKFFSGN